MILPLHSCCFADFISIFADENGFRITCREEELIGNPVRIRNYPRSCKLHLPLREKRCDILNATGSNVKYREGVATEASQKTCHYS